MKGERHLYIICASSREDMLPTAYYGPNGELNHDKNCAAKFSDLEQVLDFIGKYKIKLGNKAYIDVMI